MLKMYKLPRKVLIIFFILLVLGLVEMALIAWRLEQPKTNNFTSSGVSSSDFNKSKYSLTDPSSIWVVVNKKRPLNPIGYSPSDLVTPNVPLRVPGNESMQMRTVAAKSLEQMFAAAKLDGISLMISSAYRSYIYQTNLYNGYVKSQGQAIADQSSARPGHSEHQTGLAVDIEPVSKKCELDACFADTPEGIWLNKYSYLYGFILRYPSDKISITGYEYEPWHFRYVGTDLATELHKQHVETLEEFFNVPGGQTY